MNSCQKLEIQREVLLLSDSTFNTGTYSAVAAATIIDIGNGVIEHGHCWDTADNPTVSNRFTNLGKLHNAVPFYSALNNLQPATEYYYRAYAFDGDNYYYSNSKSFKTNSLGSPRIITGTAEYIENKKARITGTIIDLGDGSSSLSNYGHCWSLLSEPTIKDSIMQFGQTSTLQSFTSELQSLVHDTNYYFRAFAVNAMGIVYGDEIIVNLKSGRPEIVIDSMHAVDSNTVRYLTRLISDGGSPILEMGVQIREQKQTFEEGITQISNLNNNVVKGKFGWLKRATNYFFRAYAVNANGVRYSPEYKVSTYPGLPKLQIDQSNINVGESYIELRGRIPDNGGETINQVGVCWSHNENPTKKDNPVYHNILNSDFSDFNIRIQDLDDYTQFYIRLFIENAAGISYSNQISCKTKPLTGTIYDNRDGRTYKTVKLGNQWWMAENLHYKYDSSLVYNDSSLYGRYYKIRSTGSDACPTGWQIPNDEAWYELIDFLGGENEAGEKLKSTTLWNTPNTVVTNETLFNAKPAGHASYGDDHSLRRWRLQYESHFMVADYNSNTMSLRDNFSSAGFGKFNNNVVPYASVRCIKTSSIE